MHLSKKRFEQFDDYDDIRRSRLSKEEIKIQDSEISKELEILKSMQESITAEVAKFMSKEGIGINELTKRLHTNSRQTSRIIKGEANITLATLAEVSSLMGVSAKIIFEK